jgi:hypothetical protein
VIRSLTRRSHFPLDEGLIDQIVDDLAGDDDKGIRPIELQIVGSQIESEGIHTRKALKPKAEMVRAFLREAVHDCGTENEDKSATQYTSDITCITGGNQNGDRYDAGGADERLFCKCYK